MTTAGPNGGHMYTLRLPSGDHHSCDFGILKLILLLVPYRLSVATPWLRQFVLPFNASLLTVLENLVVLMLVVSLTHSLHRWRFSKNVKATTFCCCC
ncbi:hypothetical protein ABL78_3869 [Leptomonas seymouri]|uniref:Uncharacterized protein n=1 Tax=Leptomonas seymouri TaxID=5684 RepID=A0A0N0P6E4_LEPSE|nr:hypothetical protein ABL78_3869 [Leptomonas seymouri]|eukprot:KPI87057.1 hypothetical protein ABL78_3869 [Leptomonas seymouri]